jgi:DNA-binding transcriptional LysR family regulator
VIAADDLNIDLRLLRTFTAVAEELHFGRAAERRGIGQGAVSEQVRRLEDELGVSLLTRTSRSVALTHAGAVFLEHARRLLEDADAAVADARRADRGELGELTVGLAAGATSDLLTPIVDAFAVLRPDVAVAFHHSAFVDPSGGLGTGEVDVAILRPPVGVPDVAFEVLATEPRMAAVPSGHPLAARERLDIEDLLDEPWTFADTDPVWRAFWTAEAERGAPARYGATIGSMDGIFEAVRAGLAVALVPASVERAVVWEGVAFRPVDGVDEASIAVGWRPGVEDPRVRAFVAVAKRVGRAAFARD